MSYKVILLCIDIFVCSHSRVSVWAYEVENMKKQLTIVLILALIVLLTVSLIACNANPGDVDKLPDSIGGGGNGGGEDSDTVVLSNVYLKFYFTKGMSSVFKAIEIDKFSLSDVHYSIVRSNGKVTEEQNCGSVTEDMLDEESLALLSTPGHHNINVSTTLEGGIEAKGSFALHLMDPSSPLEMRTLKFNLKDNTITSGKNTAEAYFGSVDYLKNTAVAQVIYGVSFTSWSEFCQTFRLSLEGHALDKIKYDAGDEIGKGELSATTGFDEPFVITTNVEFTPVWTKDVVTVNFDLNVPEDAVLSVGAAFNPETNENIFAKSISVPRNVGQIIAPIVDKINVYHGYYFAGWYVVDADDDDSNDRLWNFTHTVGNEDVSLIAKWTIREYSFTLFTTGGVYPDDIQPSLNKQGNPILTEEDAKDYIIVEATSRFGILDKVLNQVVISGLTYNEPFDNYVALVKVRDDADGVEERHVYMTIHDIIFKLSKGDTDYVKIDTVYSDLQCTTPANIEKITAVGNTVNDIGFIKWVYNEPSDATEQQKHEYFSEYMTSVVFKDGISIKSDGTIRLDNIADESINDLKIPASLIYQGEDRPVTEIGEKVAINHKGLVSIDLSDASNLTTIGAQAFAHSLYLSTVIMPDNNNIVSVGEKAFFKTPYENDYSANNNNNSLLIINGVLYRYVGNDRASVKSVDLSSFDNITHIADGAFVGCDALESVVLGQNVESIGSRAFASLVNLNKIVAGDGLSYISDNAFDGCVKMLGTQSENYQADYNAIIIGEVYYRHISQTATTATIPANILHIAPSAFKNCLAVSDVRFENASGILSVGTNAFFATTWIRADHGNVGDLVFVKDGFVVVNNILSEYYNLSYDRDSVNIVLPDDVMQVVGYAFDAYARYVESIQFNQFAQGASIDDYAFAGASSLDSLIFTNIAVKSDKSALEFAPNITEKSFVNKNGELVNDTTIYVTQDVYNYLLALESDASAIVDDVTLNWVNFFKQNKDNFVAEVLARVYINKDVVSTSLLKTGVTDNAFFDTYTQGIIKDGLVVVSNTGIARYEDLDFVANDVVVLEDGGELTVTFTYHPSSNPENDNWYLDEDLFKASVHNGIEDNTQSSVPYLPFFNSSIYVSNKNNVYALDNHTSSNSNYWIEGFFDKDRNEQGSPIFYTSFEGLNAVFKYRDKDGVVTELPLNVVEFSTQSENSGAVAVFTVNFHNIGTYAFTMNYQVKVSKIIEIEQVGSISIPLNGSAKDYFARHELKLIGQDGSASMRTFDFNTFPVSEVNGVVSSYVDTRNLGLHTIKISYSGANAERMIEQVIVYSVTLDADKTLFNYEVISERLGTARIVGCTDAIRNVDTIVIPSRCTIDGVTYNITEIGKRDATQGVFEGNTKLKAVYLSDQITHIHTNSFKDCTSLENAYMVKVDASAFAQLGLTNFKVLEDVETSDGSIVKNVMLDNLTDVIYNDVLSIAPSYTFAVGNDTVVYNIVAVRDDAPIAVKNTTTEIFMPDTISNYYSFSYGNTRVYSSETKLKFRIQECMPASLVHIGESAFRNCKTLKSVNLTQTSALAYIGASAFSGAGLESIDLTTTAITEINNQVFENCKSLKSVVFGDIDVIGISAFNGCVSLESVDYKDGSDVKVNKFSGVTVSTYAFNLCTSLAELNIADDALIQRDAFASCDALVIYLSGSSAPSTWDSAWNSADCPVVFNSASNTVANDGYRYVIVDGVRYAIDSENNAIVTKQRSSLKSATIKASVEGASVTIIDEFAFENNVNLESVVATSALKIIRMEAFANCTALKSFTFSDSNGLEEVAKTAFEGCVLLEDVPGVNA